MTDVTLAGAFRPVFKPKRYKVFYGGRGGAKSWAFATALVILGSMKPIRVLCTREQQKSIKESVHKLLADSISRCGLDHFYEIQQATILGKNGTQFLFEGLRNNPAEIKSMEGIDICWCEEAHAISEDSWKFLIPTIRKEGSELWISFNPQWENDATAQRFIMPYQDLLEAQPDKVYEDDRYFIRKVSWRDNPWFHETTLPDEMADDKKKDLNRYMHVWEGEFQATAEGAIFADEIQAMIDDGRLCSLPIISRIPVSTFWDLGKNDTTCIVFGQQVGHKMRIVDFYENRGKHLDHYAKVLREKDYLYDRHYLPHDAEAEPLGAVGTRQEQLEDMGVKPTTVVPRIREIGEGIAAMRERFPELEIDKERCADLIKALKAYSYEYDERIGAYKDKPGPKWATNPTDALRQWAQGYEAFDPFAGFDSNDYAPNVV